MDSASRQSNRFLSAPGNLANPLSYGNLCFPENEEKLPKGWKKAGYPPEKD
jgi:hypothetical protein